MGTPKFILRTEQPFKKGKDKGRAAVDMIYSHHGQRKFFRTKIKLFPINWNKDEQEVVFVDKGQARKRAPELDPEKLVSIKDAKRLNDLIGNYRTLVDEIESEFERKGIYDFTSAQVKDELMGKKKTDTTTRVKQVRESAKKDTIITFIDQFIEKNPKKQKPGSLKVVGQLRQHLSAMKADKKAIEKRAIIFENMDLEFMENFQNYLTNEKGLANITTAKQISIFKSILKYAKKKKELVNQDYKDIEIVKVKDTDVVALTEKELYDLYNLDLSYSGRLEKVRDSFCFACVTGLRYGDLHQLRSEHIYENEIRLNTIKTGDPVVIPLTPISRAILKKYKGMVRPLPIISDQKMNSTLKGWTTKNKSGKVTQFKGLCELAGIDTPTLKVRRQGIDRDDSFLKKHELISVHTARRTFVSLSLKKGIPAQNIMKMTGHKSYRTFERYVKVFEDHNSEVMKKAWGEVPGRESRIVETGNTFSIVKKK